MDKGLCNPFNTNATDVFCNTIDSFTLSRFLNPGTLSLQQCHRIENNTFKCISIDAAQLHRQQ